MIDCMMSVDYNPKNGILSLPLIPPNPCACCLGEDTSQKINTVVGQSQNQ